MNQVELLRHVADNIEAGRPAGHGLYCDGYPSQLTQVDDFSFYDAELYSLAPKTVIINGIEVERGIDAIEDGSVCYVVNVSSKNFATKTVWNYSCDSTWLERGLVFLGEEKAIAMAKAMLNFQDGE